MFSRGFIQAARPYFSGEQPSYAVVLVGLLLRAYGVEALEWDGGTIEAEIARDFDAHMPRPVYDQLMAGLTALGTDQVYWDVVVFDQVVNGLNRASVQHAQEVPGADEVAWAVTELGVLDPEPVGRDPEQPYGGQVTAYIQVCIQDEGLSVVPGVLGWVKLPKHASDFGDDPDMWAGAQQSAQARADEINQEVQARLNDLAGQMASLGFTPPESEPEHHPG